MDTELHPWKFELEQFPSRLACGHGASSLEIRAGNFSKSVSLWTLSFILGDSNEKYFQVGYPVHTQASSLEIRTGNISKSATLWTRSFILGDSNWKSFQVRYPYGHGASSLEIRTGSFPSRLSGGHPYRLITNKGLIHCQFRPQESLYSEVGKLVLGV